MFDSGMKEAISGRIPVSLDKESCLMLVNYLYTGKGEFYISFFVYKKL